MRAVILVLALTMCTTAVAAQAAGTGTLVVANMADNTATVIDLESETVWRPCQPGRRHMRLP